MNKMLWILFLLCLPLWQAVGIEIEGQKQVLAGDLEILRLAPGVWLHTSYEKLPDYGRVPANGLLITGPETAVLVDTPWTDAQAVLLSNWARDELGVVIGEVIVTHFHPDNLGGLAALHARKVHSLTHHLTPALAEAAGAEVPQATFTDSHRLSWPGQEIFCYYPGAGHTSDNIVVWLPETGILFGGCLVKNLNNRTPGNTADADLKAWPVSLKRLQQRFPEAVLVIPGHGSPGGPELIDHSLKLVNPE